MYYKEVDLVFVLSKVYKKLISVVKKDKVKYIVFLVILCGIYGYLYEEVVKVFI